MRIIIVFIIFILSGYTNTIAEGIDWKVKHRYRFFFSEPDAKSSIFFRMQEQAWAEVSSTIQDEKDEQKKLQLTKTAISLLERKLNDEAWLQKFYEDNLSEIGITANELVNNGHARWGWAKHPILQRKTCWDWEQQWHSSCRSDALGKRDRRNYVKPDRHTIIAFLDEEAKIKASNQICRWSTKNTTSVFVLESKKENEAERKHVMSVDKACDKAVALRIPFDLPTPDGLSNATEITVEIVGTDIKYNEPIAVRDFLVVGLGDSFSSGEGNPDSPAIMAKTASYKVGNVVHSNSSLRPFAFNKDESELIKAAKHEDLRIPNSNELVSTIVPHRQNILNPAHWLDRKCHRTLYSYHNRVALQLALETNEKTAVTFLGYACSGAKLTEGILLDYYGVEKVRRRNFSKSGKRRLEIPQLARLVEELCTHEIDVGKPVELEDIVIPTGIDRESKPIKMPKCGNNENGDFLRSIDAIILSIGGNDVGFVPLIAHALFQDEHAFIEKVKKFNLVRDLVSHYIAHDVKVAREKRLPQLPERYTAFAKAFAATGIPIRKKDNKFNIFLTAFPIIERNENGEICGKSNSEKIRGMTLTDNWLKLNHERLKDVSKFSEELFENVKLGASTNNFIFVDGHRTEFEKHGFCARGDHNSNAKLDENLERMLSPFFVKCNSQNSRHCNTWFKQNNAHFSKCYASRQRWVRTFDDAFLCANTVKIKRPRNGGDGRNTTSLMFDSLGGPIHPTAEGHSHIANAVWNSMKKLKIISPFLAK